MICESCDNIFLKKMRDLNFKSSTTSSLQRLFLKLDRLMMNDLSKLLELTSFADLPSLLRGN